MNKKELIGILGSIALLAGLFLPAFSIPIMGGVSFLSIYGVFAVGIGIVGVTSLALFISSRLEKAFTPSVMSVLLVGASIVDLCMRLSSLADGNVTADNAFAQMVMGNVANAIQVGPAYIALAIGSMLMVYAASTPDMIASVRAFAIASLRWILGTAVVALLAFAGLMAYNWGKEPPNEVKVQRAVSVLRILADGVDHYYGTYRSFPNSLHDIPEYRSRASQKLSSSSWNNVYYYSDNAEVRFRVGDVIKNGVSQRPIYITLRPDKLWNGDLMWRCRIDRLLISKPVDGCVLVDDPLL